LPRPSTAAALKAAPKNFVKLFWLFCKTIFFCGIPFRSVPFRASELDLPRNSECLGMSPFFRGITETIPSLFRGIFSERNSVPNPMCGPLGGPFVLCTVHIVNGYFIFYTPFRYTLLPFLQNVFLMQILTVSPLETL
jgi:hypothetical protein